MDGKIDLRANGAVWWGVGDYRMFYAINKNTGVMINIIQARWDFNEEYFRKEIWYAPPHLIESVEGGVDITKLEVGFRTESKEIQRTGGSITKNRPHFYVKNATKLGVNLSPEQKEHTKAVNFILDLLENKQKLCVSVAKKPKCVLNTYELDYVLFDLSRLSIEVIIQGTNQKRVDVFLPLKERDPLIGFGLVFEIQLTEQEESKILQRSFDRAIKGFSIIWLNKEHFEDITSDNLEMTDKIIIINLYQDIFDKRNNYYVDLISEKTRQYTLDLDKKMGAILKKCVGYDYKLENKSLEILEMLQSQKKALSEMGQQINEECKENFRRIKDNIEDNLSKLNLIYKSFNEQIAVLATECKEVLRETEKIKATSFNFQANVNCGGCKKDE